MKLSTTITEVSTPQKPILLGGEYKDTITKAKKTGFDAVEIHTKDIKGFDAKGIRQICDDLDMEISGLGTGSSYVVDGLSLIDDNLDIRKAAIERLSQYMDIAQTLRCDVTIGCMRGNVPEGKDIKKYEEILANSILPICDIAVEKGVTINLEAINRFENNYLPTSDDICNFIEKYKLRNVKLMLDTFHMNIEESDLVKAIHRAGDLLGYFHIGENDRWYPGHGHINFPALFKALKEINYHGYVSLEYLPLPNNEQALNKGYNYIKPLL